MRPAIHHLRINAVRAGALFASPLQRSDQPAAEQVREAIASAMREFGSGGCSERVAQEFGDHPETAVLRMRWALRVASEAFTEPGPAAHARLFARHCAAHVGHAARAVHVIRAA